MEVSAWEIAALATVCLSFGTMFGYFLCALMVIAKQADKQMGADSSAGGEVAECADKVQSPDHHLVTCDQTLAREGRKRESHQDSGCIKMRDPIGD